MNTKHLTTAIALTAMMASIPSGTVVASDYGSYGSDSGTPPTDLTINKEVKHPITNSFVENLGSQGPFYSSGSTVTFRLTVKNGSGETMDVTLTDALPRYLTFVSATQPATYDAGTKKVTIKLDKMIAGETRVIELTVSVADRTAFPADRSLFCLTNNAKVVSIARSQGDEDTADLCVATSVGGAEYLPVAGFNDLLVILPFIGLGGMGVALMRKK